jgi:hypothetical protein
MIGHNGDRPRPNCFICAYFFITHEPAHPYGCRAMGFKSAQLPTMAVFASSGLHCQSFALKGKKTG